MKQLTPGLCTLALAFSAQALALDIPPCLDHGQSLAVMNGEVLKWKTSEPNQYHAQAHVLGKVTRDLPDTQGHDRFEIAIGPGASDVLEVVFNSEFGPLPRIQPGEQVEACGEFINSFEYGGGYPASVSGAIIHWVHRSYKPEKHDSGYLVIDGAVYGDKGDPGRYP